MFTFEPMKDKKFYEQKIAKAESDIEIYKARMKALTELPVLKAVKEATKSISIRVPANVAELCLMNIKSYLTEHNFFRA